MHLYIKTEFPLKMTSGVIPTRLLITWTAAEKSKQYLLLYLSLLLDWINVYMYIFIHSFTGDT